MVRSISLALALSALFAFGAFAEKPAPAASPPSSAPAPPGAPDPAVRKAKMDALTKKSDGTWTCDGKITRPDGEVPHAFTMTTKPTADGMWIQTSKEWSKPAPRRQEGFLGWDAVANVYKHVEVTSEGTMVLCTTPDVSTANTVWSCEANFQGKPTERRMTESAKSATQVETVGEVKMPDGKWQKMANSTCKKK